MFEVESSRLLGKNGLLFSIVPTWIHGCIVSALPTMAMAGQFAWDRASYAPQYYGVLSK